MPSPRNTGVVRGQPYMGGGHFTPGCWRADRPTGKVAIPEGPQRPIQRSEPNTVSASDGRPRDPRTAANLADREAALAPRRWRPS